MWASPPTWEARTGVPLATASAATNPKDSDRDGTTTRSAARYQSASTDAGTGSRNSMRLPAAEAAARSCSRVASASPEAPPSMTTRVRAARTGSVAASCASASRRMSVPLTCCMRPTPRTRRSADSIPIPLRASCRGPGRKVAVSTPGGTTRMRAGSAWRRSRMSAASEAVLATRRSASRAMRSSASRRRAGSRASPRSRSLTAAIVWNDIARAGPDCRADPYGGTGPGAGAVRASARRSQATRPDTQ